MLDVSNLKKIAEKNKTVLIRFDLNVPLNSIDDYISDRIIRIKKPILNLLNGNNKVIILSHLGRPKGKIKDELSLQQVVPQLERVLEKKINFHQVPLSLCTDNAAMIAMVGYLKFK